MIVNMKLTDQLHEIIRFNYISTKFNILILIFCLITAYLYLFICNIVLYIYNFFYFLETDSLLSRCYDKWGCLSVGEPFFSSLRPISLFPLHPDVMDAQFLLVTRSAPDLFQRLRVGNNSTFEKSDFDSTRPVKIIIHGFREKGDEDWIKVCFIFSLSCPYIYVYKF